MNLKSIISITGKPGLFKIISQTKNGFVVESLTDGKKMPIYASDKVSALEDISIYTTEEDMPLIEVFAKLYDHTAGKIAVDHNANPEEHRSFLSKVVPTFDQSRVYNSDLKKLFLWFNILIKSDYIKNQKKEEKSAKAENTDDKKKADDKKQSVQKPAKAVKTASTPKTSSAKAVVRKSGGSKRNG
ncbi:MAG: DUF5606 domain-containing protein [Flavobacteriales bacterium]|nr:DUF5606 domain-containing protein [Flavobacteriales bacterium]